MTINDTIWQEAELTTVYLEGIRGAIPLAHEQIDMMMRLVKAAQPSLESVLDLGCGDGILGQNVLKQFPEATAVFVDFSEPMLEAAQKRMGHHSNVSFLPLDYGDPNWVKKLFESNPNINQFSAIVSGFSIHHQPHQRKKEIYKEIFNLLQPEGIFINIEHVASPTIWLEEQFEALFIDALYAYQIKLGSSKSRQDIVDEFLARPDKEANILAPITDQCDWLREVGFVEVDTYLKIYELAVFGGIKPNIVSE